jgi:hypothetical protein
MRRPVLTLLLAAVAGVTSLPASAQSYCAAVVPNDSVSDLKRDIISALRGAGFNTPINAWPTSGRSMLEIGTDQGTMRLVNDMWGSGLALHATLCTSSTSCGNARTFFQSASTNNHLKRYGTSETDFTYVDLKTSYEALLNGRPYTLSTGSFEPENWGSWFALALSPSPLAGTTKDNRGRTKNTDLSRELHVSFIKVKYGSKTSTNARRVTEALQEAMQGKSIQLRFTEVKCN